MDVDPLDPDERQVFDELAEVIREELAVQVAIGRLQNTNGEQQTANLIADVVWRGFDVRRRNE